MISKIKNAVSPLAMAEASYKSAFGVIEKIEKTANKATKAADKEVDKARVKMLKQEVKMNEMRAKRSFYQKRATKIAAFIRGLDD
jgi:uncharacterized lipoprotein YehR (DUF1307 family)